MGYPLCTPQCGRYPTCVSPRSLLATVKLRASSSTLSYCFINRRCLQWRRQVGGTGGKDALYLCHSCNSTTGMSHAHHMGVTWVSQSHHMSVTWVSHAHHVCHILITSQAYHMGITCPSHAITWVSHAHHMPSHECHMGVTCPSHAITWVSHAHHMPSHECHMGVTCHHRVSHAHHMVDLTYTALDPVMTGGVHPPAHQHG